MRLKNVNNFFEIIFLFIFIFCKQLTYNNQLINNLDLLDSLNELLFFLFLELDSKLINFLREEKRKKEKPCISCII